MKQRVITGIILAIAALALVLKGHTLLIYATLILLFFLSARELSLLFKIKHKKSFLFFLSFHIDGIIPSIFSPVFTFFSSVILYVTYLVWKTARRDDTTETLRHITAFVTSSLILHLMLSYFHKILLLPADLGRPLIFILLAVVFGGDIVAYFVGKYFGQKKIMPFISPKKTIAGTVGALIFSSIVFIIAFSQLDLIHHTWQWIALITFAPILSLLAQTGDYFESLIKRVSQIKDSGTLLPGHGGILDRIDGLILTPFAYYFFLIYVVF